jgi:23S rRNA pseudouridine955/2504/2580 synthase
VLRKLLGDTPLGQIYAAFRKGRVRINGKKVKPSYRLGASDVLELARTLAPQLAGEKGGAGSHGSRAGGGTAGRGGPSSDTPRQHTDIEVAAETDGVVAFTKPPGLLTHGRDSLERYAQDYLAARIAPSLSFTPGPLHRLDRNTSGIVLFPKTREAAARFSELLQTRGVTKRYIAMLDGKLMGSVTWEDRLRRDRDKGVTEVVTQRAQRSDQGEETQEAAPDGQHAPDGQQGEGEAWQRAAMSLHSLAVTRSGTAWYTLVDCRLHTGRTHQIRAQAAAHGHPLSGDGKYGGSKRKGGYILHAAALDLDEYDAVLGFQEITSPLPRGLAEQLTAIFGTRAIPAELRP